MSEHRETQSVKLGIVSQIIYTPIIIILYQYSVYQILILMLLMNFVF